ncbi:MAG: hypothetical protein CVU90_03360 [Firmicutes bacterium HGW-Firmicutes-15]|nr:MAG: hypothetical protein CVU90_03360 [Firmicutes bacterium HGW-Firmicutes-15]
MSEAIISLDTSALIFLQECDADLAKHVMDTLLFAEERIWIAHHVANVEMLKNFEHKGSKSGAIGRLNKFDKTLNNSVKKISSVFESLSNELREEGHDLLADIISDFDTNEMFYDLISNFKQKMNQSTKENRELLQSGLVRVFQNAMCDKSTQILTTEELHQIKLDGVARYTDRIPPGYCDWDKENNEFGDLIVWKEILKKSQEEKKPLLFITRDKKEDWFKLEGNKIVGVRDELINDSKENNAEVFVIYFNDFVRMSFQLVSKNVEELIDRLDRDDELFRQIENYISENMYGEIQDKLSDMANSNYNSDFVMIDTIESISILDTAYEVYDDCVDIDCQIEFEASVDHNYHFDSREDNIEISGSMVSRVDVSISVELLSGHHDERNKTLDIESISVEFGEINIISSSDPLGGEDDDEASDEFDIDDYDEPEEY